MPAPLDNSKDNLALTRSLHPDDSYDTPASLAMAGLKEIQCWLSVSPQPGSILDPGSGDYAPFGWAARQMWPHAHITGVDKREVPYRDCYNAMIYGDYLKAEPVGNGPNFDLIAGNPPFSLAEQFVRLSIPLLAEYGILFLLLKLRFLGSQSRARGLFRELKPSKVLVLPKRPSWWLYRLPSTRKEEERKRTTSEEYAFFMWLKEETTTTLTDWLIWDLDNELEGRFIKDMEIQL